jgi:hypothetical protein
MNPFMGQILFQPSKTIETVAPPRGSVYDSVYMAFKTISLSEDAYRILKKAKRSARESFTEVVKRAVWEEPAETLGDALDLLRDDLHDGKLTVSAEELATSRRLHATRKRKR